MSRFYYGTLLTKIPMYKGGSYEKEIFNLTRNFISSDHPSVMLTDYSTNVVLFCQEISEDMYALLKDKGHFCLDELSPTDPV